MKKHKNIAVFIPHLGCPHTCVFCSQVKITGVETNENDIKRETESVKKIIEEQISTIDGVHTEIAFFGGSFTGIGIERMTALLKTASEYIGGSVTGIRCSTRPDYINDDICGILKKYGVTAVELGIQSTSQAVLDLCERGHSVEDGKKSSELIKKYGFELGGQMMIGLPGASPEDEIKTARDIISYGADTTRIYPTVVFEGTKLYEMQKSGKYMPLSAEKAIERSANVARLFIDAGVTVLRIGLHASENLSKAPAGANHPAIGEMTAGRIYYDIIKSAVGDYRGKTEVKIPCGELSKCIGQHGEIRNKLRAEGIDVRFTEDVRLPLWHVAIEKKELSE